MSALPVAESSPRRLLAGVGSSATMSLGEHVARHGAMQLDRRLSLRAMLDASGLRGRGGGAFPVARKVTAVANERGRSAVVINAAEGEPLSQKDKHLIRHVPHLVLDGAVALAHELRTTQVVVAVARNARVELNAVAAAVAERASRRHDGKVDIQIAAVPDAFVAGEETALLNFLNGGPAKPTFRPPFPFERGLAGRPTLVQNAETAAHVTLIARYGPDWFREFGTRDDPGSALFTLAGAVRRPGVYEASLGIPLQGLVALAGGLARTPQAVLVGGYFGTWFPAVEAAGLHLDDAALRARGGGLGAATVFVLSDVACGVAETARIARYLANESAGQCGPCVYGLDAIAGALESCTRGDDRREQIARWCGQVNGRGACAHPNGAARFVASALDVFAADFDAHARRRCTAKR